MTYSDPACLTRQYRDASKPNARIALHERFSTNTYGLQAWISDHDQPPKEASILDVGCGLARLWTENLVERLEQEPASHGTIRITKDAELVVARR